jgi:hypothetical protein
LDSRRSVAAECIRGDGGNSRGADSGKDFAAIQ